MNIISINKLTYRYYVDFIFYNFTLNIKEYSWTTITGPNGSGKSTLLKIITGLINTESDIKVYGFNLNKTNINEIRKNIGVVLENIDNSFICETLYEELESILENIGIEKEQIKYKIEKITQELKIKDILYRNPHTLSGGEKEKAALSCALINNPKILILDEAFAMLESNIKEELLKILRKLNQEKKITIINFTHDLKEAFFSDRLIVLNKGEIILDGPPKKVFEYDRVLNKIGIEIPFVVDLSLKLKLYGLLDKISFDLKDIMDNIWE